MTTPQPPALLEPEATPRRWFLRQGTLACLAAGGLGAIKAAPAQTAKGLPNEKVTRKPAPEVPTRVTFEPHLSEFFEITDPKGNSMQLLLLGLSDVPERFVRHQAKRLPEDWHEHNFSILFRGSVAQPLMQETYALKHPVLGELSLFLVPVERVAEDTAWRDYEAVFNRLIK